MPEIFRGGKRITQEELDLEKKSMEEIAVPNPSAEDLDVVQGQQMLSKSDAPSDVERVAAQSAPPESALAVVMATVLNPSAANLERLAGMFAMFLQTANIPDYLREAGQGFLDAMRRWATEQNQVVKDGQ